MKKQKKFDCVQMKWDIQKKIEREYRGIPEHKARQQQLEAVRRDPLLGPFIKKVRSIDRRSLAV
jgi:hypothetical protein